MSSALRLRRLDALHALACRLAAESAGGVLGDCLDVLLDATPARCAVAFTPDGALEPLAERRLSRRPGLDPARLRHGAHALAERAATARRAVVVSDVRREADTCEPLAELAALGVRAVLAEPIMHRRAVLATLVLMFDDAAMLDAETRAYVTTVCAVAALALERDRQLEEGAANRNQLVTGGANAAVGLGTAPVARELESPPSALALQRDELRPLVGGLGILVIDDDAETSRTLRRALTAHEVRMAASVSEAEILLLDPAYAPELVLCNVLLPGANGHVLHQRLRLARPDLAARFVFVTAGTLGGAEADYVAHSGRPTLLKPIDVKAVLALLAPATVS